MPNSEEILGGLTAIARSALPLAVLWHVALAASLLALALGVRPSRRWAAATLALPLGSVSALAWVHGNPFNAAVLGLGSLALLGLGLRLPPVPTERASTTGMFGVLRLGIAIDALLTIGALILLGLVWSQGRAGSGATHTARA